MRYFQTLPLINQIDPYGNQITVNNIISRAYLLPSLQNNLMLFYTYDVKDGDTPENMTYRYYGDVYRYWILMYSNGIIDPYSQWPLTNDQFTIYLLDKYKQSAANSANVTVANVTSSQILSYTSSTVHHYEQYITTINSIDNQGQTITIQISGNTYNSFVGYTTTSTFNDGSTVTKSVSVGAISIYNYELGVNESKRNIRVMNTNYVTGTEQQLQSLMR